MKEDTNKILFGIGCIFLTLGVLSVTILPLVVNAFDMFIFVTTTQYRLLAVFLYTVSAIAFLFTIGYYKKEAIFIMAVLLYFGLFQAIVHVLH